VILFSIATATATPAFLNFIYFSYAGNADWENHPALADYKEDQ
jgi:hypothetical protein